VTDLDDIRARHAASDERMMGDLPFCKWEGPPHIWPCDTARVLAALDAANDAALLRPGEYVRVKVERDVALAALDAANADAERLAFMLNLHRETPTGRAKTCRHDCDACAALRAHEERVR
jgi:hypothetical protein